MTQHFSFSRFRERLYNKLLYKLSINIQEKINFRSKGLKPPSLFKNCIQKNNLIILEVKEPLSCFQYKKMGPRKFIIRYKIIKNDLSLKAEYTIIFTSIDNSISDFEMKLVSTEDVDSLNDNLFISDIAFTQQSM